MKITCKCGQVLRGIDCDWVLSDQKIGDHQVATIGNAQDAAEDIKAAAQAQIAANLAAYDLDYDYKIPLKDRRYAAWAQVRGQAFIQCPSAREKVTAVSFPR